VFDENYNEIDEDYDLNHYEVIDYECAYYNKNEFHKLDYQQRNVDKNSNQDLKYVVIY